MKQNMVNKSAMQNENTIQENNLKQTLLSNYIKSLDDEKRMKFWIKTLLSSYGIFPEIIKTIDKIIELKASSVSFASDIYNFTSTYNQVEQVIDLTERKNYLLNIHCICNKILESVNKSDFEFLEKRFVYNWKTEELASEFNISTRTVYRRIEKLIDDIYLTLKANNWSTRFIESQIKNEDWLKQRYYRQIREYFKFINYGQNQSQSSSDE